MDHRSNAHYGRLFIRGLLILLCIFAIPKLVSGEPNAGADQATPSSKKAKGGSHQPWMVRSRLFPDGNDCAVAKVDLWLQRGMVTYAVFLPGESPAQFFRSAPGGPDGTTILVGEKDCLVRIRIERASDASIYTWPPVRRPEDGAQQPQ